MLTNKRKALIAGTFDPITVGHEDVVRRASEIFDEVYVAVVINNAKNPIFTAEERVEFCKKVFCDDPGIKVVFGDGLLSDLAETFGCGTVVKGLRNSDDFVYEFEHAQIYRGMTPSLETVFIPSKAEFMHISSGAVKAIISLGGDASAYVSSRIYDDIRNKLNTGR